MVLILIINAISCGFALRRNKKPPCIFLRGRNGQAVQLAMRDAVPGSQLGGGDVLGARAMAPKAAHVPPLPLVSHVVPVRIPAIPCLGSCWVSVGSAALVNAFYSFLSL